jgi:hypothetical protein
MPLSANLNVSPYFDDYDEDKQYYRVLFKPQVAVQARELNQVQSILQNQIERFGNWAFQNGDIVSGCTIIDIPSLPFIRLQDFQVNGASFDVTSLVNTQVVSATSNLTARVFVANSGLVTNYPNTNIVYVQYVNTGNTNNTAVVTYSNNETLNFYSIPSNGTPIVSVNVYATSNGTQSPTGNAHGISVSEGIVFINGVFAKIVTPTFGIVNNFGTYAGNNVVGFKLSANSITENQDSSLYDNALGYSNENAPGAHRLKLVPTLISLDPVTASNTTGFNPIATYNYGSLVSKSVSSNVYSVVGEAIATRIYDESGNYVVNPFIVDTVTGLTGNSIISTIDANTVLGRVSPGVGYAQGQRVEILKTAYINMRRGIDTQSFKSQQITFNYGNYFTVNEVAGIFPFSTAQNINLYDSPQQAVTKRTYASIATANGNLIGTASLKNFNYISGVDGTNTAVYTVHVFNIKMNGGYQVNQIKSIGYTSGTKGFADLTNPGVIDGSSLKDQLYNFGVPGLKNLKDDSNNNNTQYIYRTNKSATMAANGLVTVTISGSGSGGSNIDILPYGIGVLPIVDTSSITLVATANVDTAALGGSVTTSSTNTTVTGSSTNFLVDFYPGSLIKYNSVIRTVVSVTNSSLMTVDASFGGSAGTGTYYKTYLNGSVIPFSYSATGPQTGYVYVSNSTSFQIRSTQAPSSSLGVQVFYDILRTNATASTKAINKNRFVRINVANNAGGVTGPWCLGVSDLHQITAVYGASSGTFCNSTAITATNITNQFSYDTGQKDTHYDYGYLYPTSGFSYSSYPYLLVQMDYFTPSAPGFFSVESYPIDDANTANTTAIQTKDIPLYVDETGKKNWLRDYIDFRPVSNSSANNTGVVSNVVTSVSYATINPAAANLTPFSTDDLNVPAYGRNMQSNFTMYLPRNDLVTITPDGTIKVIEGQPKVAPQTPIFPDNSMAVAVIKIPPYPSLSTDQVDSDQAINKLSKNLIRDTSTAISTNLVMNRRYTMQDIGKLDKRITNLEYYTQLSLLQQKATDMVVTDSNGLNRFKNGIFADSFDSFLLSDVSNPEYSIAIDRKEGKARPKFVLESFKFDFNSTASSNVQKTGRVITLPYTSVAFITQPYATKYRSSAHVASHWSGFLELMPSYSNNIDYNQTASVGTTIDNTTPWKEFANSPFGSIWGAWQTSVNTVSSSVQTGQQNTYNISIGYQYTNDTAQAALDAAVAKYQSEGFVIGGTSLTFSSQHGGIGSNSSITQVS